ncbi:MAG: hypothetical protein V2B15_01335 [Bacteroidota bacterium]
MKYTALLIALIVTSLTAYTQTVENIRVVQDGENLKITYRIGASSDAQLYNVKLSCSMDGGKRFEPAAVIGDVGENIIGGKSFYTIIWDVFSDVEEVVNPEFFIKVDLVSDASVAAAPATTRSQEPSKQEPVEQKTKQEPTKPASTSDPGIKKEVKTKEGPDFDRNGFFSFSFATGMGIPFGISFGSLNNWGYYVTPMRMAINTFDQWYYDDYWGYSYDTEVDFHYMLAAGVTKHFVSAGFYRLHGYWGLGSHVLISNLTGLLYDPTPYGHGVLETGVVNVLGRFNITIGLSYSIGFSYNYPERTYSPTNLVFGAGFVF